MEEVRPEAVDLWSCMQIGLLYEVEWGETGRGRFGGMPVKQPSQIRREGC